MFTYLLVNIFTLLFPVIFSFEKKIRFFRFWRYLFPAIIITAVLFIGWDYAFTLWHVWGFNPSYLIGFYVLNLPIEEVLFFVTVPFACVFVYEVLIFYLKKDYLINIARPLGILLALLMIWMVFQYPDKLYTSVSALIASVLLVWHHLFFSKPWLGRFWMAYIVCLIPFFIVNGILTSLPVVQYNNEYNLGIRMFTIPVEDLIYQFDLMMLTIMLYEKQRSFRKKTVTEEKVLV